MVKMLKFLDVNSKPIDAYYNHLSISVSAFKFILKYLKLEKKTPQTHSKKCEAIYVSSVSAVSDRRSVFREWFLYPVVAAHLRNFSAHIIACASFQSEHALQ